MSAERSPLYNLVHLFALVVIAIGLLLGLRGLHQLGRARRAVDHAHAVEKATEKLLSTMKDVEVGQRGFLLSRDTNYLDPYKEALVQVDLQYRALADLLREVPDQIDELEEARALTTLKQEELRSSIALGREGRWQEAMARVHFGQGRAYMDSLRERFGNLERIEGGILSAQFQQRERAILELKVILVANGLAAIFLLFMAWLSARRHMRNLESAAQAVDAQRQYLRTTLHSIGDGVITTDAKGRVESMNAVAEALTGWEVQAAKGEPLESIFPIVNETTRQPVDNPALRALREGTYVGLANHTVLLRKDGGEVAIDDSAAPIRLADGTIAGSVLIFRDIGAQRITTKRMEASEARSRAMLSTALDAIITMDHEGSIIEFSASAERIFGMDRETVIGRELAAVIIPEEYREHHRRGVAHYLKTGEGPIMGKRVELEALRADGTLFPCELTVSQVPMEGDPLFTAFIRDITDRRLAEEELRHLAADLSDANRRKAQFIATLAHELRNPLAPLGNALELLKIDDNAHHHRETLAVMERQVSMLVRLIDDLLDMSRIDRGLVNLRVQPVDLVRVVRDAIEATKPLLDAARHTLTQHLPPEPVMLKGDPQRLVQVFANLLNNSAKYTPEGGLIHVEMEIAPEWVEVVVRDNGMGIPPTMLRKVFDLFTQMDHTLSHAQGGLGIGLSLVNKLVALHGGTIDVASAGVDQGASFTVRLTCIAEPSSVQAAEPENVPAAFNKRRILVVDDNADSLFTLSMLLKRMGHQVYTAADGTEALKAVKQDGPEVVLMDIGMPKLNGYEAARQMRGMEGGAGLLLIALTGWGQEEDRARAHKAGFDHHMVKPVELGVLKDLIASMRF